MCPRLVPLCSPPTLLPSAIPQFTHLTHAPPRASFLLLAPLPPIESITARNYHQHKFYTHYVPRLLLDLSSFADLFFIKPIGLIINRIQQLSWSIRTPSSSFFVCITVDCI